MTNENDPNPKILYIGPGYYNYDEIISNGIRGLGWSVDTFAERPKILLSGLLASTIHRISPLRKALNYHHAKWLKKQVANKIYDFVFVIKGNALPPEFYKYLRKKNPTACFVLYQWDCISRVKDFDKIREIFDHCYTFDRRDAENDSRLNFQPLFYSERKTADPKTLHGIVFIGTLHSSRLESLRRLDHLCDSQNISRFFYVRVGALNFIRLLVARQLKNVYYRPLDYAEYVSRTLGAEAVLDFPHPQQTGLTMRTLEALGLGKKIITTNQDIVNYPFFDPKKICVIEEKNPKIPEDFLNGSAANYPPDVIESLSLKYWLTRILGSPHNASKHNRS